MVENNFVESSVKHEYEGEWKGKTRLTTCDPHAKRTVTNSESPQEVENNKEIIFTYDVEFQVSGPFFPFFYEEKHIATMFLF